MLVSVYICTRNRLEPLRGAIESVLGQTHEDFELIIVDDASTDGTAKYLELVKSRDPRILVLRNESMLGTSGCGNRAIEAARGEFITGLGDGDQFRSDRIAGFLDAWKLFARSGERFSCIYSQDILIKDGVRERSSKRGSVSYTDLFRRNVIGTQVFARRTSLVEIGGFNDTLSDWHDLELFMRLLARFGPARLFDAETLLLDNDPHIDHRARSSHDRVIRAYQLVVRAHSEVSTRLKQELLLQAFSDYYRIPPRLTDWCEFFRYGFDSRNFYFLCRAALRLE